MQKESKTNAAHQPYLDLARAAMHQSYSPYSGFAVGAVVVTANDKRFSACNVENAAYPEGTCAEAGAIAAMIMAGERRIREIYVMGGGEGLVTPCGGCRQRIREFADADTLVHVCSPQQVRKTISLDELLPYSFGPEHQHQPT